MQIPLFEPISDWKPPLLSELPSWNGAKRVAIDTETCDPFLRQLGPGVRRGSHVAGYSFAIEDGPKFYVPLRHKGGDNVDAGAGLRYLEAQAEVFDGILVGMNLSYDLDFLAEEGIEFKKVKWFRDISVADVLIYELHNSYSMQSIAERYGLPGKDETLLKEAAQAYGVDPKGGMHKLPGRFVGPYGEMDAALPLQILRKQEFAIEENDLWNIFNLESEVLPVLVKMRRIGVKIDLDQLSHVEEWSLKEEATCLQEVKRITGYNIGVNNVWKAAALAPALESQGIELDRTPKTGAPSIKKDVLEKIDDPVAKAIVRARKVNKIRTTFAASIREHMTNGRIHCTINQMARDRTDEGGDGVKGTRFGRCSSENPNMQQQPSPDKEPEIAGMWRKIYIPEEGGEWGCFDYSQQEPRLTIHYAEKSNLPLADEAAKRYREDPNADNHQMMADLAGIERKPAKEIFLGIVYGMGGVKLCQKLGLPTKVIEDQYGRKREVAGDEGQALLNKVDNRLPFLRMLADKCQNAVKQRGYIITLEGRHLHFEKDQYGNYDWTHKALNRLIQGSAADQTKRAIVELDKAGYTPQLQVHDEVDLTVYSEKQKKEIEQIMLTCVELNVPSKVDIECGPSWGEIK